MFLGKHPFWHALNQPQDNIILPFRSKYSCFFPGVQTLARRVLLKINQVGIEVKIWILDLTNSAMSLTK